MNFILGKILSELRNLGFQWFHHGVSGEHIFLLQIHILDFDHVLLDLVLADPDH